MPPRMPTIVIPKPHLHPVSVCTLCHRCLDCVSTALDLEKKSLQLHLKWGSRTNFRVNHCGGRSRQLNAHVHPTSPYIPVHLMPPNTPHAHTTLLMSTPQLMCFKLHPNIRLLSHTLGPQDKVLKGGWPKAPADLGDWC